MHPHGARAWSPRCFLQDCRRWNCIRTGAFRPERATSEQRFFVAKCLIVKYSLTCFWRPGEQIAGGGRVFLPYIWRCVEKQLVHHNFQIAICLIYEHEVRKAEKMHFARIGLKSVICIFYRKFPLAVWIYTFSFTRHNGVYIFIFLPHAYI